MDLFEGALWHCTVTFIFGWSLSCLTGAISTESFAVNGKSAIYAGLPSNLIVEGSRFIENYAIAGGAIYCDRADTARFDKVQFLNNTAERFGCSL